MAGRRGSVIGICSSDRGPNGGNHQNLGAWGPHAARTIGAEGSPKRVARPSLARCRLAAHLRCVLVGDG
eukprot:650745-Prymnesium_polylepis.1